MTTTNLLEKEKKLRKRLRIKEVCTREGRHIFYPQQRLLGMWVGFEQEYGGLFPPFDYFFDCTSAHFQSLDRAKEFIDEKVRYKLSKEKVIYHNVNYLTS